MASGSLDIDVTPRMRRLFPTDGEIARLFGTIHQVVQASLQSHPMRNPTMAEVQRRVALVVEQACSLRENQQWGVVRTLDSLGAYLRSTLDGIEWVPDTRRVWVPSDGRI